MNTYTISYNVVGAATSLKDFDEIYWNVIGNSWVVPIEKATTIVNLPQTDFNKINSGCYEGIHGSKDKCNLSIGNGVITMASTGVLNPGQGLTFYVDFPKGAIDVSNVIINNSSANKNSSDNYSFLIILGVMFGSLVVAVLPYLLGRKFWIDPKGLSTIIAEYEPPQGLKPILLGSVFNGNLGNKALTSGIIYLARQGFLKIKKDDKKWFLGHGHYTLEVVNNNLNGLDTPEQGVMELFFGDSPEIGDERKLSDIKTDNEFSGKLLSLSKDISELMVEKNFFKKNSLKVKIFYTTYTVLLLILSIINPMMMLGTLFSIVLLIKIYKKVRTKFGAEVKDHIAGFEEFLKVTGKDKFNFETSDKNNTETFMEFLPYAIALGVEKNWAERFSNLNINNVSWYQDNSNIGVLSVIGFTASMSSFSTSFGGSVSQGGGFSGGGAGVGGFSGGGFGGGGGGSW